jgi:hypothetical protein
LSDLVDAAYLIGLTAATGLGLQIVWSLHHAVALPIALVCLAMHAGAAAEVFT